MTLIDKCPHSGKETIANPRGQVQFSCGCYVGFDEQFYRSDKCLIAELKNENDILKCAIESAMNAHKEPCDEHAHKGYFVHSCEQCKNKASHMAEYWINYAKTKIKLDAEKSKPEVKSDAA